MPWATRWGVLVRHRALLAHLSVSRCRRGKHPASSSVLELNQKSLDQRIRLPPYGSSQLFERAISKRVLRRLAEDEGILGFRSQR